LNICLQANVRMEHETYANGISGTDQLLTVAQVCCSLGVSRDWVYKHASGSSAAHLQCVRLGRLVRFRQADVTRYVEARLKGHSSVSLATIDGIARANGRERKSMARRRFQKGHVRLRQTKNPYWEGFYWEDIRLQDGTVARKQRAINLGRKAEFPTKQLAERKLAERLAEVNDLDYRPRPVITIRDFVESVYRKLKLPTKKHTTKHSYSVVLEHHILPAWGDRQMAEVSEEDVQAFINQKTSSGLAWNTVRNIKSVLSAVFAAAVKFKHLRSNPVRSAELSPEPPAVQPDLLSDKELDRLARSLDEPYRTMVLLISVTGLRISELLALRWKNVDWQRRSLWVREVVHDGEFERPKTHRSLRPIRLGTFDLALLKHLRKRTPEAKEDDWLFPNSRGAAPYRADNLLEKVIRPAVEKLGITRTTWHLLRHWHSTVLHEEGVPIKVAQERLGHSRAETTMKHYVHLTSQADESAAQIAARRLRAAGRSRHWRGSVSTIVSRKGAVQP